jgi:hypothetical protein
MTGFSINSHKKYKKDVFLSCEHNRRNSRATRRDSLRLAQLGGHNRRNSGATRPHETRVATIAATHDATQHMRPARRNSMRRNKQLGGHNSRDATRNSSCDPCDSTQLFALKINPPWGSSCWVTQQLDRARFECFAFRSKSGSGKLRNPSENQQKARRAKQRTRWRQSIRQKANKIFHLKIDRNLKYPLEQFMRRFLRCLLSFLKRTKKQKIQIQFPILSV